MSGQTRVEQARSIKASLEYLQAAAVAANLRMVAHMIGCAVEAANEVIEQKPLLRLVKTGK